MRTFLSLLVGFSLSFVYSEVSEDVINANHTLSSQIFYFLDAPGKNYVFSPYSLQRSLSLIMAGARGETEKKFAQFLGVKGRVSDIPYELKRIDHSLKGSGFLSKTYEFLPATALWIQNEFQITRKYADLAENQFDAHIDTVDFNSAKSTVDKVNAWVKRKTDGKITQFLSDSMFSSNTKMLISDAVYFKGNWRTPFDTKLTKKGLFYPLQKQKPELTIFMNQVNIFPYYEDSSMQMVALPFKTNRDQSDIAMVIYLPKIYVNQTPFEYFYGKEDLLDLLKKLKPKRLNLTIPKFQFRVRSDLSSALQTLGLDIAFSKQADFSGISGSKNLFLSKVFQETLFTVDESGVLATATTSGSFDIKGLHWKESPVEVYANRPFLYLLVDLKTGLILFMGEYDAPEFEKFKLPPKPKIMPVPKQKPKKKPEPGQPSQQDSYGPPQGAPKANQPGGSSQK